MFCKERLKCFKSVFLGFSGTSNFVSDVCSQRRRKLKEKNILYKQNRSQSKTKFKNIRQSSNCYPHHHPKLILPTLPITMFPIHLLFHHRIRGCIHQVQPPGDQPTLPVRFCHLVPNLHLSRNQTHNFLSPAFFLQQPNFISI